MNLKRWIIIVSTFVITFVVSFVLAYSYLSTRLAENAVGIIVAEEGVFDGDIEIMPEEVEIISEDEYMQSLDIEIEPEDDEAFKEAIEAEYRLAAGEEEPEEEDSGAEVIEIVDDEIFERVEITDRIYNLLLIGDDARINQPRARSDTLILISYNRDTRTIYLTSFMRDMFVPTNMSGGSWNRINSIYSAGGPGRAINVLNHLFSLDMQRYAVVRFASVFALVDQLNGLEINMNAAEARVISRIFPEFGAVTEGVNLLNGRQVLAYARMRNVDAYGDINRTMRQRYVLKVALDKVLDSKNIADLITLAGFALDNIETNVPLDEILTIGYELFTGPKPTVEEMRLPIDNSYNFARYYGASVIPFDFRKNITALHENIYGSAAGVRIPSYKLPSMDAPTTQGGGDEEDDDRDIEEDGGENRAVGSGTADGRPPGGDGADGADGDASGGGANGEQAVTEATSEASKTRPESRYTTTTTPGTTTRERWTPTTAPAEGTASAAEPTAAVTPAVGTTAPAAGTTAPAETSPRGRGGAATTEPTTRARRTTTAVPAG